jgi:hypothetical protein
MLNVNYFIPAAALVILAAAPAAGQEMQVVSGTEITASGGGLAIQDGGAHTLLAGSVGTAVSRRIQVFGEFAFSPLGSDSATFTSQDVSGSGTSKGRFYDINGGIRYHFPLRGSKLMPYVIGGAGMGYAVQNVSVTVRTGGTQVTEDTSVGGSQFGFNGGGGLRYAVSRNFGLRPEFRLFRYVGDEPVTSYRFAVGVYYQFGR